MRKSECTVKQNKDYCVYGLLCPLELKIRYIGQTGNLKTRALSHRNAQWGDKLKEWVKYLKDNNTMFIPVILKEFDDYSIRKG